MPNTPLNFDKYLFKQGGKDKKKRWEMAKEVHKEEMHIQITDNKHEEYMLYNRKLFNPEIINLTLYTKYKNV